MPPKSDAPSLTVLEETPVRAIKFLTAASRNPKIFAVLATRGYTKTDHSEGWELLLGVTGYRIDVQPVADTSAASKAIVEIDSWDEPNFRVVKAALRNRFPEQMAFLFNNLEAATGAEAVLSVTTLLDRLDELQAGKSRKATHKTDLEALALLATRGITPEERARMRELIKVAAGVPRATAPAEAQASATAASASAAKQQEGLKKLRAWYDEWSEIARVTIKRRDHLIQMGLAKRKSAAGDPAPGKPQPASSGV